MFIVKSAFFIRPVTNSNKRPGKVDSACNMLNKMYQKMYQMIESNVVIEQSLNTTFTMAVFNIWAHSIFFFSSCLTKDKIK